MNSYTKLLLAALTVTAVLAMAIGSASANRLSFTGQSLRITWTSLKFRAGSSLVLCPVTLEASFHSRTIVKTAELIGYVTRATVTESACTGGHLTFRQESLPWHVRFRGYSGVLPNITLLIVAFVGASYRTEAGGLSCNSTTSATKPLIVRYRVVPVSEELEALVPEPNARIPLEGGLCPFAGEGSFEEASQTLTQLGTTAKLFVTLI